MDSVYSHYSKEGRTPSGHKTGQKLLMKDDAKLAAGTVLEAAHKLNPNQVPDYLAYAFEDAWNHYDQNHEGWIRYEETHTFQRYLNGHLNGFYGADGSITDIAHGGNANFGAITYPAPGVEATPPTRVDPPGASPPAARAAVGGGSAK